MYNVASEETYQDGQLIFKEGSSGDWIYVIISGSVEIFKTVEGKEIIIELLQTGEVFGELSFLGGIKRTASARAAGETTLGIIERSYLDLEFNKIHGDFRTILVTLAGRFKKMLDRASDFTSRKEERVEKTLSLKFKTPQSFKEAYTANISTGGLFIRTQNPLKTGEQFLLKMQMPGLSELMKIKCEVAWARKAAGDAEGKPAGMGVKFIGMPEKDNQMLKKYYDTIIKDGKQE